MSIAQEVAIPLEAFSNVQHRGGLHGEIQERLAHIKVAQRIIDEAYGISALTRVLMDLGEQGGRMSIVAAVVPRKANVAHSTLSMLYKTYSAGGGTVTTLPPHAWKRCCYQQYGMTAAHSVMHIGLASKRYWIKSNAARQRHGESMEVFQEVEMALDSRGVHADVVLGKLYGAHATAMTTFLDSPIMRSLFLTGFLPVFVFTNIVYQTEESAFKPNAQRWTPLLMNTSNCPAHRTEIFCIGLACFIRGVGNDFFIAFPRGIVMAVGTARAEGPMAMAAPPGNAPKQLDEFIDKGVHLGGLDFER
ncbi:hypothetical protein JKP88DRAFT_284401 [Tribonema minus]|uniref:Uncharacterized protein n=1 Tax=Tribonema minus TaxID=303371 RepID=A0A836CMS4_9STRA|nr:hypothetical protein JKP88DRAFT_284401 [Tribonema minus]